MNKPFTWTCWYHPRETRQRPHRGGWLSCSQRPLQNISSTLLLEQYIALSRDDIGFYGPHSALDLWGNDHDGEDAYGEDVA